MFESLGCLDKLEAFASKNGARFYALPENAEKLTLERRPWTVPASYPLGGGNEVVPLNELSENSRTRLPSEACTLYPARDHTSESVDLSLGIPSP